MKIKLSKDFNDLKAGAIIDVDEKEMDKYVKEGHILYTEEIQKAEVKDAQSAFKAEVKEKIMTTEIKKEVEAPNVIIKNENRLDTIKDITAALTSGKVKELKLEQKAPAGMNDEDHAERGAGNANNLLDGNIFFQDQT